MLIQYYPDPNWVSHWEILGRGWENKLYCWARTEKIHLCPHRELWKLIYLHNMKGCYNPQCSHKDRTLLLRVIKARMLMWFAIPFSSKPNFVRPWLTKTCPSASPHSWQHVQCPGFPSAYPHWECKPSPHSGCWSMCCLWEGAKTLLKSQKGILGKTQPEVKGHSEAEGSPPLCCCWLPWDQSATSNISNNSMKV